MCCVCDAEVFLGSSEQGLLTLVCAACGARCHQGYADAGGDDAGGDDAGRDDDVGIVVPARVGSWMCHQCEEVGVGGDAHSLLTLAGGVATVAAAGSPPATPPRADARHAAAPLAGEVDPNTLLTFAGYSALWHARLLDPASDLSVCPRFRDAVLRPLAPPAEPGGPEVGGGAGGGCASATGAVGAAGSPTREEGAAAGAVASRRLALLRQLTLQRGLRPRYSSYRRHLTDRACN